MKAIAIISTIFGCIVLFGGFVAPLSAPQEGVLVGTGIFFLVLARLAQASHYNRQLMNYYYRDRIDSKKIAFDEEE